MKSLKEKPKILSEKIVHTDKYAGCIDILTGIDDFKSEVEFDEEWHSYSLNGEILPSVTQLLDDGEYNNKEINPYVLQYACDKGTIVHKEIEEYLKDQKEGFTKELYDFIDIYTNNIEKFKEKAIFDIKTYSSNTKAKREKCYKQTKMYADAVEYMTKEHIDNLYEIWLPKNQQGKLIDLKEEFEDGFSK